jgi:hypothetical protein
MPSVFASNYVTMYGLAVLRIVCTFRTRGSSSIHGQNAWANAISSAWVKFAWAQAASNAGFLLGCREAELNALLKKTSSGLQTAQAKHTQLQKAVLVGWAWAVGSGQRPDVQSPSYMAPEGTHILVTDT